MSEIHPALQQHLVDTKNKRKQGERGKQKTPTKEPVYIRLSPDVINHFRATGKGWQGRVNEILKDYVATQSNG